MNKMTTLIFLVIVSNAGGEGKTLLAQLMQALWQLLDEPVHLLDGDPGNKAAKVADNTAKVVGWGVDAMKADEIVAATAGHHVILDLGANSLASAREIVDLLPALQRTYAAAGYRTIAFMPVSTNKIGSVGAIQTLALKVVQFEKLFVRINRDGSGTYDAGLTATDVIDVGHLAPGFQNYVRRPGTSLATSVSSPDIGYNIAATFVATWMRTFATQQAVHALVGDVPVLIDYEPPPGELRFGVTRLKDTTDEALTSNIFRSRILAAIGSAGWTADGLRKVATMIDLKNI